MMRTRTTGLAAAIAAAAAGCGDNARVCGAGTVEHDGVCLPMATASCGDGTRLDHDQCVVDPASCRDGTVLIADRCVDPTAGLIINLEESPEPNGLGREIAPGVEDSAAPAGVIALPAPGHTVVIHGHFTPFRDADGDGQLDPDVDTYLVTAVGPTMIDVTVDGVGGALGAFYLTGRANSLPAFERYGVSVTGDTAQRRLFLPAAGDYALALADTRTIAIGKNPPPPAGTGAAVGGHDAQYYASITSRPIPDPIAIPISAGAGTRSGTLAPGEVGLFTAVLGAGPSTIADAMPGAATASIATIDGDRLGYADENPGSAPPTAAKLSLTGPASPLIIVDAVYNYGPAPEPFTLTITPR